MRASLAWGVLLCLALLVLMLTFGKHEERTGTTVGFAKAQELDTPTQVQSETPAPQTLSREPVQDRTITEGTRLSGLVLDSDSPIAGARLTLTLLTDEDREWETAWHKDDWGALDRKTLEATSDLHGRFSFDVSGLPHGGVLWASHPGYLAGLQLLGSQPVSWPSEIRIVLNAAPVLTVFVQDAHGRPAPGALVVQYGLTPDGSERGDRGVNEQRARRLLTRESNTGADGNARLEALPGEQIIVASRNAERSAPWRGLARERVTLTLVPTFEVGGQVVLPDLSHASFQGECRVTIAAQQKNLWRSLYTMRSVESGDWGPASLPLLDVERYRIRLEGGPIIPVEIFFSPPATGARLKHDLVAELGIAVYARVTDENTEIIEHALAKAMWQDPQNPEHWNFVERGPIPSGEPNEGMIALWSVPRGAVMEASAQGYATARTELVNAESYETGGIPITLKKAARVRGRCLHMGKPVSDFEVLTWRTSDRVTTSTRYFDREDGSFELETAPEGDCWITACSGLLPGCEPRQIRTAAGTTTEVVLELPESLRGVGQVVDEETGEPIQEAQLQLFVPGDVIAIARWGDPIPVGVDGVFEIDGFRAGKNELRVLAKGYSRKFLTSSVEAGGVLDWGVVGLARSHTLTLVLEDTTGKNDFDRVQVSGRSVQSVLPSREVDSKGRVEFADVGAGDYDIFIEESDATTTLITTRLAPGRDWTLRHRIAGSNRVTVEAIVSDPAVLAVGLGIAVTWSSPLGYKVTRTVGPILETARVFEVDGIDSDSVQAEIYDFGQKTRAITSGKFSGPDLHLTLELVDKPLSSRSSMVGRSQSRTCASQSATSSDQACSLSGRRIHRASASCRACPPVLSSSVFDMEPREPASPFRSTQALGEPS